MIKTTGDVRIDTFRRILSSVRRGTAKRSLTGRAAAPRLLDLATGHGMFALAAHDMGWSVTAVDVRTKRMPRKRGIRWKQADVRDFDFNASDFDVITVLGLLYHLELPDQLSLLRRCVGATTILDTHVSLEPDREEHGYRGHYFDELAGRTIEEHTKSGTASWKNLTSFWAAEESLIQMFHDCGFRSVFKLMPSYEEDRTFWICL